MTETSPHLMEHVTDIVVAYVRNNSVATGKLPTLIGDVHAVLSKLGQGAAGEPGPAQKPAVDPKRSVKGDHIVCLEDGKHFKSLKRHLMAEHGMTPDEYRAKWNLSSTYPIVAPEYAASRSEMAKSLGLGRKPGPVTKGRGGKKT